ncbi:MAG: hypothetical protein ACJ75G_02875 [Gaiellaceae bacterium]
MKRLAMALAAAIAVAAVCAGVTKAAPVQGGTFVRGTWSNPGALWINTIDNPSGLGLAPLGCPFMPHDIFTEGETSQLTRTYSGWLGVDENGSGEEPAFLHATLDGTLQDAAGNTYTMHGRFLDTTPVQIGELEFSGVGQVVLSGPAGMVVGRAEYRLLDAPGEEVLMFTSISRCSVSQA